MAWAAQCTYACKQRRPPLPRAAAASRQSDHSSQSATAASPSTAPVSLPGRSRAASRQGRSSGMPALVLALASRAERGTREQRLCQHPLEALVPASMQNWLATLARPAPAPPSRLTLALKPSLCQHWQLFCPCRPKGMDSDSGFHRLASSCRLLAKVLSLMPVVLQLRRARYTSPDPRSTLVQPACRRPIFSVTLPSSIVP